MSDAFKAGFEAAKREAIACALGSEYWGNCVRGCKAVQHSIELMQMMQPGPIPSKSPSPDPPEKS